MVMVRPMLFRGPDITISGRTYTFRAAIDRTFGASDVIYLAQGEGPWTYAVVQDGLLQELVPWDSRRAVLLMEEVNVWLDHLGWLRYTAPEDGEPRCFPLGEVPKVHMGSLDLWVQRAVAQPSTK